MSVEKTLLEMVEIKPSLLRKISVDPPVYIFSDRQIGKLLPIKGIHVYGPYDYQTTSEHLKRSFKGVEIFVLYPNGENNVKDALIQLISFVGNGYSQTNGYDTNFDGFRNEFRLERLSLPEIDEFVKYEVGNLSSTLNELKSEFSEALRRENVPLVIIGGTSHRSFLERRNQYVEAKRCTTSIGIPVQYASYYEVKDGGYGILYQISKGLEGLGYSLWNFSLNLYGKVGGIPWIVRQGMDSNIVDISIGLRFAKTSKGYVVGHAVILDSFGRLIGTLTSSSFRISGMKVPRNLIREFLSAILEKALKDPRIVKIYENGKKVLNIALHRLNFFHPEEIEGVKEAIEKTKIVHQLEEIKLGLVSVIDKPTFTLFNDSAESKSAIVGTGLIINEKTAVVCTAGSLRAEDKRHLIYPVIVSCQNLGNENSLFDKIEDVCKHVVDLAALHWQTVVPASIRLPATLEFAQNVARLYVYGVQPPSNSWLERTLWFI